MNINQQITLVFPDQPVLSLEMAQVLQGPRGLAGPGSGGGEGGGGDGALLIVNRLSELNTEEKRAAARANIGLAVIDGGTFN